LAQSSKPEISQITSEQAQAELDRRKMKRFFKVKSFKCTFEDGYFTFWKNGKLEKEVNKKFFQRITIYKRIFIGL